MGATFQLYRQSSTPGVNIECHPHLSMKFSVTYTLYFNVKFAKKVAGM
jgi:hypothetical protein